MMCRCVSHIQHVLIKSFFFQSVHVSIMYQNYTLGWCLMQLRPNSKHVWCSIVKTQGIVVFLLGSMHEETILPFLDPAPYHPYGLRFPDCHVTYDATAGCGIIRNFRRLRFGKSSPRYPRTHRICKLDMHLCDSSFYFALFRGYHINCDAMAARITSTVACQCT